jgi:hypothetical protein
LVFAIIFIVVSSVSALDMTAGGEWFGEVSYDGGTFDGGLGPSALSGVSIFFGLKYAEIFVALSGGTTEPDTIRFGWLELIHEPEEKENFPAFNIGLLGKFPVSSSEKVRLSPVLGMDYEICVSGKRYSMLYTNSESVNKKSKASDFNRLWFRFGLNADYGWNDYRYDMSNGYNSGIYFRFGILYGIGLKNKYENDLMREVKEKGGFADINLRHSLGIRLGLGFVGNKIKDRG